jgi:hypothetical protein
MRVVGASLHGYSLADHDKKGIIWTTSSIQSIKYPHLEHVRELKLRKTIMVKAVRGKS